jgi:hypothetical protein
MGRLRPEAGCGPDQLIFLPVQMEESVLLDLAKVAWSHGVPLLVARSYGLVGYIR